MTALLRLGGLPPLPGFWSKWLLIYSAVSVGDWLLAFIGVFNSVLAILYYLWLFQRLFLAEPSIEMPDTETPQFLYISLMTLMLIMLAFGIYPTLIYAPASEAARYIVARIGDLLT